MRPAVPWLPLAGLIPSFALALWSLTQPWAKGRAFLVWGIARSPSAALLVIVTLVGVAASTVAIATRGRRHGPAALLHLTSGVLMLGVGLAAYRMVTHTEVRALGILPLASIGVGRGLRAFLLAAILVFVLGLIEALVARSGDRSVRD
ncbi:MAG: hypothetical protein U0527_15140 [Candidatus Eisenbacteria bacterium]